jgi:hypothetical protein
MRSPSGLCKTTDIQVIINHEGGEIKRAYIFVSKKENKSICHASYIRQGASTDSV